jgi:signal peptidase I
MTFPNSPLASENAIDRGSLGARLLKSALHAVWFVVVPALMAGLSLRYLVPAPAEARGALSVLVARLGSEQSVPLAVGFFLLFAFLFRYWRFYLPGGRHWAAPPHLDLRGVPRDDLDAYAKAGQLMRAVRERRTWSKLEASLSPDRSIDLERALSEVEGSLAAGDLAGARRAERTLRELASSVLRARERRQTAIAIATAAVAGLTAVVLRSQVFTPCRVLSASMLPTLSPGDLILADRLAYGVNFPGSERMIGASLPRRGDIIVFRSPPSEGASQQFVKRVIGLSGDRIGMHGSRATINGWEVPACDAGVYLYVLPDGAVKARLLVEFLEEQAYLTIAAPPAREFPEPYDVKPGEVFVLGDNRNNSSDSRAWNEGHGAGLPLAQIDGRARWFLLGTRRDQRADLSRMLESIAGPVLHLEGLDLSSLREEIARCLRQWPEQTRARGPGAIAPAGSSLSPAPAGRMIGE